jgi:hypothetical protein
MSTSHAGWSGPASPVTSVRQRFARAAGYFQAGQGATVLSVDLTVLSPSLTNVAHKGECRNIGQPISVKGADFPADDPVHIKVCSTSNGCDPSTLSEVSAIKDGSVKFTGFEVDTTICSTGGGSCYLQATDASYSNGSLVVVQYFPVYRGPIARPPLTAGR